MNAINENPKLLELCTKLEAFTLQYKSDTKKLGIKNLQQFRDLSIDGRIIRPQPIQRRCQGCFLYTHSGQY